MPPNGDGWDVWSKHVLKELERLNECYEGIAGEITQVRVEIATLKVKSGIWGLVGGAIPVAIGMIWIFFGKK